MPFRRLIVLAVLAALTFGGLITMITPAHAQDLRLLYLERFTNNAAKWEIAGSNGTIDFTTGGAQLSVEREGQAGWMTPALTLPDDIDVEVEAQPVNPTADGAWNFAVLLRSDKRGADASFYHFGVNGQGSWELSVRPENPTRYAESLESGRITGFNARATTTIRISARGNSFTFSINGRQVKTYEGTDLPSSPDSEKYIGLMVGTYTGTAKNTVLFKRVSVWEPATTGGNVASPTEDALLIETFPLNNPTGWGLGGGDSSDVKIEKNSLSFKVLKANVLSWSRTTKRFPADIDVTVALQNETPGLIRSWTYGLGVRAYKEGEDTYFYLFEIRGSGRFTFTAQRGGSVIRTLIKETALPGFRPNALNILRVRAVGNTFELYFNNTKVGTAKSTELAEQEDYGIVLSAGTFDAPQMQARFSSVVILPAK